MHTCLPACLLSACLCVCLSVCVSVCLSVCLLVCLFVPHAISRVYYGRILLRARGRQQRAIREHGAADVPRLQCLAGEFIHRTHQADTLSLCRCTLEIDMGNIMGTKARIDPGLRYRVCVQLSRKIEGVRATSSSLHPTTASFPPLLPNLSLLSPLPLFLPVCFAMTPTIILVNDSYIPI